MSMGGWEQRERSSCSSPNMLDTSLEFRIQKNFINCPRIHSLWASIFALSPDDSGLLDAVEHRERTGVVKGDLAEGALGDILCGLEVRKLQD